MEALVGHTFSLLCSPSALKEFLVTGRDFSDSGSVQRTMGQGSQLPEATGKDLLLRTGAEDMQWSLPASIILGCLSMTP